jgi:hypothetical protein
VIGGSGLNSESWKSKNTAYLYSVLKRNGRLKYYALVRLRVGVGLEPILHLVASVVMYYRMVVYVQPNITIISTTQHCWLFPVMVELLY